MRRRDLLKLLVAAPVAAVAALQPKEPSFLEFAGFNYFPAEPELQPATLTLEKLAEAHRSLMQPLVMDPPWVVVSDADAEIIRAFYATDPAKMPFRLGELRKLT